MFFSYEIVKWDSHTKGIVAAIDAESAKQKLISDFIAAAHQIHKLVEHPFQPNSETLKTVSELEEGDCIVVTRYKGNEEVRHFEGSCNPEFPAAYFAIPNSYEIIGFLQ